jgi:hypothetical protein
MFWFSGLLGCGTWFSQAAKYFLLQISQIEVSVENIFNA